MVIGFYDMPDDWRPPKEIWMNDDKLEEWFRRKKNETGKPNKNYDYYITVD